MQNKHTIRDRCILLTLLFIFSIGTYSLFGNIKSVIFYESAAYQHRVKGTVTDSNGVPIAGATVTIKGTSIGTFTNEEGVFFVNASPSDVFIITYIGFKPFEIQVGNSDDLSIVLQEDVTNLDAVTVNAGYYTVKERERTGSIAKVTSEDIELQPIVSPLEALQGRMAGVEIQQRNGIPGNAPEIRIRGQNSLRPEGNFPLYIVDGVPIISTPMEGGSNMYRGGIDPLGGLNLSNIESIEVLKDADATAIYGSRGANGVVLITTKKGDFNRKTAVEVRLYSGLGKVSRKMDLLNTEQYITLRRAALENDGRQPDESTDYDLLLWNQNRYTDWQEVLFGEIATITDINIAASGGNATTSFRLGGSYHKEGIVFPGDNHYQKITTSLNLNHVSEDKKLKIAFSANYGLDKSDVPAYDSSFITMALSLPPNAPKIYNNSGSLHWEKWEYSSNLTNPLAAILNRTASDTGNNLVANLGITYNILDDLSFKVNGGYTHLSREFKGLLSKNEFKPEDRTGRKNRSTEHHRSRRSWIIEPQLRYNTNIGKGTIDGLVGLTFQQNESRNLSVTGEGFASEALIKDLASAEGARIDDNTYIMYKYNAVFARLGYNWNKKYYINLTGRRDGSSRFGPDKRFTNFWAVGGAWIFSEEPFMKNHLPFMSFGKFRGSYGITGSDQIGDYGWIDAYESTEGSNGLYPTQLTNRDYSWEENKKIEAALEFGFLKNRITFGVSWYRNRSSNQLVGFPLPSITGFNIVQANLPATVQNTGWEFEFSSLNINSKNFKWQTFINLSFPNNKLISFPDMDQTSYANIYRVGHPLNILLLYQYNGIDSETGLYQVTDENEDGRLDYVDQVVIKNVGRKYFGGLTNNFSYKGIELTFLWEFIGQNGRERSMALPGSISQQTTDFFSRWQYGENPNIQQVSQSREAARAYNTFRLTDQQLISKASFIRLRTLSLSYSFPVPILQKLGINQLKLFLQGQNLFTASNYHSLNLDNPGSSTLPSLRTIALGAQIHL